MTWITPRISRQLTWWRAIELLSDMPQQHKQPTLFIVNQVLAILKDANKGHLAFDVLHSLPSIRIQADLVSYNTVTSALERSSFWQKGVENVEKLVMDPATAGLLPNVISFNALLACVRRSSNWRAALLAFSTHQGGQVVQGVMNLGDLLLAIRKARVQPDGISHATAVSACADAVKWAEALALLYEINFTAPRTQRTLETSQIAAVTTVLTACSSVSKWLQGLKVLADAALDGDDFDAAVVGAMVNACALGQAWELAVATWQLHHSNEVVHRSAIAACELGSWQMALALLQIYHHRYGTGMVGTAMATVAAMAAGAKATQWPLVLKLLEETGRRGGGWELLWVSLYFGRDTNLPCWWERQGKSVLHDAACWFR